MARVTRKAAGAGVLPLPGVGMRKRSVTIGGHRTSISLEDAFWEELTAIATTRKLSLNALVAEIDRARGATGNLSSALRLHVLEMLRQRISRV